MRDAVRSPYRVRWDNLALYVACAVSLLIMAALAGPDPDRGEHVTPAYADEAGQDWPFLAMPAVTLDVAECPTEDVTGQPGFCVWDARHTIHKSNRTGRSFVTNTNGVIRYVPHWVAHYLMRDVRGGANRAAVAL